MEQQFRGSAINREDKERAHRTLLTVSLFSIVMLFAGFTSAYIVSSAGSYWVVFDLPPAFMWSTIIIVLSSVSMFIAQKAIKKGQLKKFAGASAITMALGIGFALSQFAGWGQLVDRGILAGGDNRIKHIQGEYGVDFSVIKGDATLKYVNGEYYLPDDGLNSRPVTDKVLERDNTASSYWYLFTFMHLLHLVGGLIALIVITLKAYKQRYSPENHNGVTLGARYWHFLGGLWIYLYAFLYIIH